MTTKAVTTREHRHSASKAVIIGTYYPSGNVFISMIKPVK